MTKHDKHMGMPKPKYDPKLKRPKFLKASKAKPWMLMIPEREPTPEEETDVELEKRRCSWFPEWWLPWKEKRIDKYGSLKSAKQALATHRKKAKAEKAMWPYHNWELDRAVIINTTTGEKVE